VVFGVRKPLASWNPFWANLQVYDYLLFDARKTARWQDKISVWFRRTGWRPTDVAGQYPNLPSDLGHFTKFDAAPRPGMRYYVLAQFAVVLLLTIAIGRMFGTTGPVGVLIPCLMLWAALWTIGLFNEGREHAVRVELARLLLVVPVGAAAQQETFWPVVTAYIGLSLAWLVALKVNNKQRVNKLI
jgi:alkylglycerol monooxygenase